MQGTSPFSHATLLPQVDATLNTEVLHTMSEVAFPEFRALLKGMLPHSRDAEDADPALGGAGAAPLGIHWSARCVLKCSKAASIKKTARMEAKVEEYVAEGQPWPRAARVIDSLRATVMCDDSETMWNVWLAVNDINKRSNSTNTHRDDYHDARASADSLRIMRMIARIAVREDLG